MERLVFLREVNNNMYGVTTYFFTANPSKAEAGDKNSKLAESVENTTESSQCTIRISSKAFFASCNQSKNNPDESNAMP